MLWAEYWAWLLAALVLGVLEMVLPAYIFLGFAIGAAAVGLLLLLGLLGGSLPVALLVFALGSLVGWIVLRRVLGVRAGQVKLWDRDVNDN